MSKIKQYFYTGTGWSPSDEGLADDLNAELVSIPAKIYPAPNPEPSFWKRDVEDRANLSFKRVGSVQNVAKQAEYQNIHRGIECLPFRWMFLGVRIGNLRRIMKMLS